MEFVNEKELISIIVPVFNARKYIRQTIESVRRQTIDNWELLLVKEKTVYNITCQLLFLCL